MRLTILGNNGPYPTASGACSGYLVSHNNINVLVDCGLGVTANLLKYISFEEISAVVFTHLHFDHVSDGLNLPVAMQVLALPCPKIYAPETPVGVRALLTGAVFSEKFSVGDMQFELFPAKHPVEAYSIRITCEDKVLVMTGDTNWHDNLVSVCRDADLLLADAAFLHADWNENKPHLSAMLCGKAAREAGAKKLVLTHLNPKNSPDAIEAEAREQFGDAYAAEIGAVYEI